MIKTLNLALDLQQKRAKEAGLTLAEWQRITLVQVNSMSVAARIASQNGQKLNPSKEDIERLKKKMNSAFA